MLQSSQQQPTDKKKKAITKLLFSSVLCVRNHLVENPELTRVEISGTTSTECVVTDKFVLRCCSAASRLSSITQNRNLVDPASVICLSQRLSHACLSISFYTVKLRMAHYISYSLFDSAFTWITVGIRELIHANGSDSVQAGKECIY